MEIVDYEALFMMLPSPKMVIKANAPRFTIISQNVEHARLLNSIQPQYRVGMDFLEAFPDSSESFKKTGTNIVIESLKRVVSTGKPDSLPDIRYDLADADGIFRERWWRATHYPLTNKSGKVIQILQNTQDITQELVMQRIMQRATSQLNLALEIGLVSTYSWNIKSDVVTGDKNLADMFGVTEEQAREGLPLSTFITAMFEDDRERVSAKIQHAIKTGEPYETEYRTYRKDGSVAWVIARGTVQKNDTGEPETFVGILIDISERKQAETELENVKRMFDALFESTILSVAIIDIDGNILQANKTFLASFGYSEAELKKGMNSRELTPIVSRQVTEKIYNSMRTKGEAKPVEKEYLRKDGTTFTGLVGVAQIPGEKNLYLAFILDISETKRLKDLNAAKDEFIALASHQLRTPATAVKQYLGIILEGFAGDISPEHRGFLQTAYDSNERELTIINDLLKTAQLDTSGYTLRPKEIDVVALIKDVIEAVRPVCIVKQQKIKFTHDPVLKAHIDVDETRIVLSNLIENAHKYSESGKTIYVDARSKNQSALITVRDEGVGIAEQNLESIFEKFTRIENPLSVESGGNGLGLYWVKRIVTLHGGTLRVNSEIGKGTTFMVELPL